MSNVNIKRVVENIRLNTTVYTPVVEMIVNGIQAIDESKRDDGRVLVRVQRSAQAELGGYLREVTDFNIEDNGIGFTDEHRASFDTLYTDTKIKKGAKGFGRFICLKYFNDLRVKSVYQNGDGFKHRSFSMGKEHDIIVGENVSDTNETDIGSTVTLAKLKGKSRFDKKLRTIARNIVEHLLPYFITEEYECPDIVLCEQNGSGEINLNDFVNNELPAVIQEINVEKKTFTLGSIDINEDFLVRVFKFYSPRNQKSRISLVAHKREVPGSAIHKYVPEFEDDFIETAQNGKVGYGRNYIIKAYVFSDYLDRNVSLERGDFKFRMDIDAILGISQTQIEEKAAEIASEAMGTEITSRQQRKRKLVQKYVDEEAPWHKTLMEEIDLRNMPYRPKDEVIEIRFQKEKFSHEVSIRKDVAELLTENNVDKIKKSAMNIVNRASNTSKNDLIHYVAMRRTILDIFGQNLKRDDSGAYSSEGTVHDIIFPRKGDSDVTSFDEHNLWLVDERLNFTTWVASDIPLNGKKSGRPDLLAYNKRVLFRGDNKASNPVTIFEFKRPQRDDFANPSSREDPVEQIVLYVNDIRDGKYRTPEGRDIKIMESTQFYGYVVCDLTPKVEDWLKRVKNFTPMPDRQGWFQWMNNINLYIEVISWDKVLKDAKMRNQIFFEKLGI